MPSDPSEPSDIVVCVLADEVSCKVELTLGIDVSDGVEVSVLKTAVGADDAGLTEAELAMVFDGCSIVVMGGGGNAIDVVLGLDPEADPGQSCPPNWLAKTC